MRIRKIIMLLIVVLAIILSIIFINIYKNKQESNKIDIKKNKDTIYSLFNNFPESNNIYYTSRSLYSDRDIGPTIYQLDILAELTDEGYNNLINQVEFKDSKSFEMKINPNNLKYNWKEVKNIQIIESKDIEEASIKNIYLDENTKTIYIIAMGGN